MKTNNFYDVIIVGGGVVGLTLASALSDGALQLAIIDKTFSDGPGAGSSDLRISAITPATQFIFERLGVWQHLPVEKISGFEKMHVWTPEGNYIDFANSEIGVPYLGYIIENNLLQRALHQQLITRSNIHFIPASLQTIQLIEDHVEVCADEQQFNAPLLIGADGANSLVRQLAQMELTQQSYEHTSIVATVTTELPHQKTAWQCFLPNGPLAFLPLADPHTSSIVWSTTPAEAEQLLQKNAEDFSSALAQAFHYRLGSIQKTSERLNFSLQRRHVKHYVKPHIALVGDAAHTIHPLAGQGLNLGILDADCLANIVLTAKKQNHKIGSYVNLRKYERARKADNTLMFNVVDNIKQLFGSSFAPVKLLRNTGLNLVNNLEFVKRFLIKQAIGARD